MAVYVLTQRLFLLFTFGIPATIIGNQLRNKIN